MKHNIIITLLILFIAIPFQACDDEEYLTDVKIRSIDANDQWKSIEDLEVLVNGAYWHTSGEVWNDSQLDHGRAARILQSDIAAYVQNAGNTWEFSSSVVQDYYNRININPENSANQKIWEGCYKSIASANEALDFIENNPRFDDPNNWYPRIIGELHFIRAFNYFLMAKIFAPPYDPSGANDAEAFPLRTSPTEGLDDANMAPATVQQVYDLIISDLETAVENLPDDFESASNPPESYADGRGDKYAAAFLLARVYFQTGQWGEAVNYATMVIDESGHDLTGEPIDAWTKVTKEDPIGNEVVWFYQFYAGDGVGLTSNWKYHRVFDVYNASRDLGGNSTDRSIALSDAYLARVGWINSSTLEETADAQNDKRYQQLYKRYEATDSPTNPDTLFNLDRPYVWVNKYYRGENSPRNTSIPLFRLPEMYLTRAIIYFLGGNGASQNTSAALADVNAVRQRAGLGDLSSITEDDIHNERVKELAFEGDWLPYLQALQKDIGPGDRENDETLPWNSPKLVQVTPVNETRYNNAYQ